MRAVNSGRTVSGVRRPSWPSRPPWLPDGSSQRHLFAYVMAIGGPVALTLALGALHRGSREYVFVYMGGVALLGFTDGLGPALVCAVASFLLIDYAFVPPVYTLTLVDEQDAF